MVFDAHDRAFAFFGGACTRGIYDNMKTAVETVFVGKERQYNRRFLQMCSHYLIEPVACTPASGWEKGQVENQVNLVRERFFTPRLRFKSYDELNGWLLDKCISYARAHKHVDQTERTIWEVFEGERPHLSAMSQVAKAGLRLANTAIKNGVEFDLSYETDAKMGTQKIAFRVTPAEALEAKRREKTRQQLLADPEKVQRLAAAVPQAQIEDFTRRVIAHALNRSGKPGAVHPVWQLVRPN